MRVIAAIDGSESSYEAVRALAHFSSLDPLVLLTVIDVPDVTYQSVWLGLEDLASIVERDMREDAQRLLDRAATLIPSDSGPVIRRIEKGKAAEMILRVAEEIQADLIVLGARGLNRLAELVLGSVSHRVLTHATCSTLIVKAPFRRLDCIVLCIQGQEDAQRAIAFLTKKPFRTSPRIAVLHVVPFAEPPWLEGALVPESYRKELLAAGDHLTNQVAFELAAFDYTATPHVMVGAPAVMIAQFAKEHRPDLILVGSHYKTGLSRFLLGSVSHAVTHHVSQPVMVVRGKGRRSDDRGSGTVETSHAAQTGSAVN